MSHFSKVSLRLCFFNCYYLIILSTHFFQILRYYYYSTFLSLSCRIKNNTGNLCKTNMGRQSVLERMSIDCLMITERFSASISRLLDNFMRSLDICTQRQSAALGAQGWSHHRTLGIFFIFFPFKLKLHQTNWFSLYLKCNS